MFFKVVFKNEIHVLRTENSVIFKELTQFISSAFKRVPKKYQITYKDADGDTICLFNDLDLKILLESGLNRVRLEIQEASEDFYDETQEIEISEEPEQKKEQEIVEPIPQKEQDLNVSSILSNSQSLDDSISEKISKMMPQIVNQIKEEILSESKSFEKTGVKITEEKTEKIQEKVEPQPKTVHSRVICDECHCNPIVGVRYKCAVCADFDLCEKCEATTTHDHPFLKIKHLGQTPLKIIAILDSEEESLEFNGQRIPLNGVGQCLNAFGTLFGQAGGRCPRQNMKHCKKMFKRGMKDFMEQMKVNNEKFEEKKEEPKTEVSMQEQSKDEPVIVEEEIKKEEVVEVVEEKREERRESEPVEEISEEDKLIDNANYISDVLGFDFNAAMHFARKYPEMSKEDLLMKYIEQ